MPNQAHRTDVMLATDLYFVRTSAGIVSTHKTPELAIRAARRTRGGRAIRMTKGGATYPLCLSCGTSGADHA